MKIFYNTTFDGHCPVGTSAIIVARDKGTAVKLLEDALVNIDLKQEVSRIDLVEVLMDKQHVKILNNGDY